jgi:hypothetical protein
MLTDSRLLGNEDLSNASLGIRSRVFRVTNSILYDSILMDFVDSLRDRNGILDNSEAILSFLNWYQHFLLRSSDPGMDFIEQGNFL